MSQPVRRPLIELLVEDFYSQILRERGAAVAYAIAADDARKLRQIVADLVGLIERLPDSAQADILDERGSESRRVLSLARTILAHLAERAAGADPPLEIRL